MKKVLLSLLVLLFVVCGGVGGYVYFIGPANAKSDETEQRGKSDKDEKKDTQYVEIGRLILPIIGKNGVSQVVHMTVKIAVLDKSTAEKVERLRPRIRDAYLQDMYGVLTREAAMRDGILKVKLISKRLEAITQKVMGGDNVHEVLIQSVRQRPA